jgi:hypothetical protein
LLDYALFAVLRYTPERPANDLANEGLSRLRELAATSHVERRKFMALHVIGRVCEDIDEAWLAPLSIDDSEIVRREANLLLARQGNRESALRLLAELRERPSLFALADELWRIRGSVRFTPQELAELEAAIERYREWLRLKLSGEEEDEKTRSMAMSKLWEYIQQGLSPSDSEVAGAASLASSAHDPDLRLEAVNALFLLGTEEARLYLHKLASKRRPKAVSSLASELLASNKRGEEARK